MEVKKRILYSTPHMGGKRLKKLARMHSRRGTMDSFVGDLESRLDRFIYRCNFVPSIFAARQMIGHGHILVNGRAVRQSGRLLKPHDIVEPAPQSSGLITSMIKRRLENNTFVFEVDAPSARRGPGANRARYDAKRLQQAADEHAASYRRLPPPRANDETAGTSAAAAPALPTATQEEMDALVPAIVASFAGDTPLGAELRRVQSQLTVVASAQRDGEPAPALKLAWRRDRGSPPVQLATLDRVAVRRLLLALLALRPAEGATPPAA